MSGPEHIALRPSWDCGSCGKPWPCDPAREGMAAEDPITRSIFLSLLLHEAAGDMPTAPPAELFERFVAWTRPSTSGAERAAR